MVVAAVKFRADHSASLRERLWGKLKQENVFAVLYFVACWHFSNRDAFGLQSPC